MASNQKTSKDIFPRRAFRTNYNTYPTPFECVGESMTQQSFKDECDLNVLLAGYKHSPMPFAIPAGNYGDFSEITDFQGAHDAIQAARDAFAELPARVRERFHNDPAAFLQFAENPQNLNELARMGLAEIKPPTGQPRTANEEPDAPKASKKDPKQENPDAEHGVRQAKRVSPTSTST